MRSLFRKRIDKDLPKLILLLRASEKVADATGVPYLKGLLGTAAHIAELVQKVKSEKEDCVKLAKRAGELALALDDETRELGLDFQRLPSKTKKILLVFSKIEAFMNAQASRKWTDRLMNQGEVESCIKDYSTELEDSTRAFGITSLLSIETRLIETTRVVQESLTAQTLAIHGLELQSTQLAYKVQPSGIQQERDNNGLPLFFCSDIRLRCLSPFNKTATFEAYEAAVNGQLVIIRKYRKNEDNFAKDLAFLNSLWHPNIPQLIGRSHIKSYHKFLILCSGTQDLRSYLSISHGSQYMLLASKVAAQCYSALDYMVQKTGWDSRTAEIQISLNQDGQVFLDVSEPVNNNSNILRNITFLPMLLGAPQDIDPNGIIFSPSELAVIWQDIAQQLREYTSNLTLPHSPQMLTWTLVQTLPTLFRWPDPNPLPKVGDVCIRKSNGQLAVLGNLSGSLRRKGWTNLDLLKLPDNKTHSDNPATTMGKQAHSLPPNIAHQGLQIRHTFTTRPHLHMLGFGYSRQSPETSWQVNWYTLAQHAKQISEEHHVASHNLILITGIVQHFKTYLHFVEDVPLPENIYYFQPTSDAQEEWGYWSIKEDGWENHTKPDQTDNNPITSTKKTNIICSIQLTKDMGIFFNELVENFGPLPAPEEPSVDMWGNLPITRVEDLEDIGELGDE